MEDKKRIWHVGMLWFDASSRPVGEKVRDAARYYSAKYERRVTVCEVSLAAVPEGTMVVDGILVQPVKSILEHHMALYDFDIQPSEEGSNNANQPC